MTHESHLLPFFFLSLTSYCMDDRKGFVHWRDLLQKCEIASGESKVQCLVSHYNQAFASYRTRSCLDAHVTWWSKLTLALQKVV